MRALAHSRLVAPLRPVIADLLDLHLYTEQLSLEMRETIIDADGREVFDSGWWEPNAMANEGQASVLNVYWRETAVPDKYLTLLNMPGSPPGKTTTMASMTEATTPGTDGYDRQQIVSGDWSSPALSSGDEQIQAAQQTFGPFSDIVPVSHVAVTSTATGTGGIFILSVPTAYFTANVAARNFAVDESYLVTLRDKQV